VKLKNFILKEIGKCVRERFQRYGGRQNRGCFMVKEIVDSFPERAAGERIRLNVRGVIRSLGPSYRVMEEVSCLSEQTEVSRRS
jgi:hypothetical protein